MPVTLIDAHVHLWNPETRAQPWMRGYRFGPIRRRFCMDDLRAAASGTGVMRAVLIQNLSSTAESLELLAIANGSGEVSGHPPHIAGVVGWVNLEAPSTSEQIDVLRKSPGGHLLVGIRHPVQDESDPRWLARRPVIAGLRELGAAGLTFDVLVSNEQLPSVLTAVRAAPGCRFIIDHLGRPPIVRGLSSQAGQDWRAVLTALAAEPNVAVKVSGLFTEAGHPWALTALRPWVEAAAAAFGPDRLMFASDWPVCLLAVTYSEVVAASHELIADLAGCDPSAVLSTTARRWYGLSG